MDISPISLASAYAKMESMAQTGEIHPDLPADIRTFAAEVAFDAMTLQDDDVLPVATEIDEQLEGSRFNFSPLQQEFDMWLSSPPRDISESATRTTAFALQMVRLGIARRRFSIDYAARFPDRSRVKNYPDREEFIQGYMAAFRLAGHYHVEQRAASSAS